LAKSNIKKLEFLDQNFAIFRFFKFLLWDQILPTMKSIPFCTILFLSLINYCECKPVQNIAIMTESGYENFLFAQLIIKQLDYESDTRIRIDLIRKRRNVEDVPGLESLCGGNINEESNGFDRLTFNGND
jgi:hypothetical protein